MALGQVIRAGELIAGFTIDVDGQPIHVLECQLSSVRDAGRNVRLQMRNLLSGTTCARLIPADYQFELVEVRRRPARYQARLADSFVFSEPETHTQVSLDLEAIGEYLNYLRPGVEVVLLEMPEYPRDIEFPLEANLIVEDTTTVTGGILGLSEIRSAVLEGGMLIVVPARVGIGDVIRIDTRTGEYVGRATL
ncbi:MAG TPA: hypothetical protein VMP10_03090 [Chloroflexota bacterium]|nr:hypothetical protein [Chloroflexota bacterium]